MLIGVDGNEANIKNRVGSGQYAYELLQQFAKIKDHQFLVYLKGQPLQDLPHQSENFKYQFFGPARLWTQIALPFRLLLTKKPDVFFSMTHYGPRFSKVPYVITIFDLSYLHFPGMFKKSDLYQLRSWTKYSITNSAHIIAISQTTKNDIIKNYQVDPIKITVTHLGYDQKFKPQTKNVIEKIKKKYKITGDYLVFVGTLQPRKNLEKLLEAFNNLTQSTELKTQKLHLVIAGKKGWLYDSIFAKVKDLNIEHKTVFTDYVPDEDLSALISGAKAYVLPSLWEGFGIPVIEAQACGVPVVVSNTSSLPEIVGESGVLIDPESVASISEGIKKVLTDQNLRKVLISRGEQNIKRFSWAKCASETLSVLEKVAIR